MDRSPHVYFVGAGAEAFAAENGMLLVDNSELVIDRERRHLSEAQQKMRSFAATTPNAATASPQLSAVHAGTSHDTVGAVALDGRGNLAAATSTGGTVNKSPGRVGDSSLIGCGCYADNLSAAVSLTGWGEPIMKLVLGKWAVDRVQQGTPPAQAAEEAIAYLFHRLGGHGGIILLGPAGRFGVAHNTQRMAWGTRTSRGMEVFVR
jgi:beta-aspartyl-peptidase (threonine type)